MSTPMDVVDRIKAAAASSQRLRVVGAGRWLGAGRPVASEATLSLAGHRGIVEYVPGDLTLTARAGTPLAEIAAATSAEGQWLPLDPWGGDDGTLGATLSTATAGPHAFAMGLPRDVVLGIEFVSGAGQVIRGGGRVVKNVAGFDLTRMLVGSWGTLGVITEATVRLRARPEQTRTLAIAIDTTFLALNQLATKLRALPFTPLASELLNDRLAARLGLAPRVLLLVRVGGNEKSVAAQLEALRAFGDSVAVDDAVWDTLRTVEPANAAAWRWSQLPTSFADTWSAADRATRVLEAACLHGNPARGVVRVFTPPSTSLSAAELSRAARTFHGTVVIESLPGSAWAHVDSGVAEDPISRAIRRTFNPGAVLNAGILGAET